MRSSSSSEASLFSKPITAILSVPCPTKVAEVLPDGLPLPLLPGVAEDGLDVGTEQVEVLGSEGSGRHPAVPDHLRGDPLLEFDLTPGIVQHHEVRVAMAVYETW